MKNHLLLGNWNALCDSCGRKYKASQLRKRWDGLMVCEEDWEQRHPQDLLRVQREQISVPFSRPYPAQDTFIPENLWTKPEDALGLTEQLSNVFAKRIGTTLSASTLNGQSLNSSVFNFTAVDNHPEEMVNFTESVLIVLARFLSDNTTLSETFAKSMTKQITESLSVAESLYFAEQEHSVDTLSLAELKVFVITKVLSDSTTVTETTTYTLTSATALNGAALNIQTLG